jgi:hypothetical protein
MFRPLVLFFQLFKRGTLAGRVTFGAMLAGKHPPALQRILTKAAMNIINGSFQAVLTRVAIAS